MNQLGIYFGPKKIDVVETSGRKIINSIIIPQSTISSGELEEKVPSDVKSIEIIAFFKEELRKNRVKSKEATICLSGRDLIIRTFEIPILPRGELSSAINFEVKKYIPFKVEELVYDFQVQLEKQSKTNLVLFMGIKKEVMERYISILGQSDVKISGIEYSGFNLIRLLKLFGYMSKEVRCVLGADLQGEDEINFTVLENEFPLFSREIYLEGEKDAVNNLDKLKSEIRVSLDYFSRKFPAKNLKEMCIISSQDYRSDLEVFCQEVGLSSKFIDLSRYIDRKVPYSLSLAKGYSASLAKSLKTNLRLNLLEAKDRKKLFEKEPIQEASAHKEGLSLLGIRLDFKFIVLGLLICGLTFAYGIFNLNPLQKKLADAHGKRLQVSNVNSGSSYEDLMVIDAGLKKKLDTLDKLVKKQLYLTTPLNLIPAIIPEGIWLTNLDFKKDPDKTELDLEGFAYLEDTAKEFEAVNKFVSDLKQDPGFIRDFPEITLVSVDRKQVDKLILTSFFLSCKPNQKRN